MVHLNPEEGKARKEENYQKMKKLMTNMNRSKITIRVPVQPLKKFKKKVLENDSNVSDVINAMILKYIEND